MVGLLDDARFHPVHPHEFQAAQRAAEDMARARATFQAGERKQQGSPKSAMTLTRKRIAVSPPPAFPRPTKPPHPRDAASSSTAPARKLNYLGADLSRPELSRHDAAPWPVCPAGMPRPSYRAEDFQTPYQSPEFIQAFYDKHPALSKRNFYIIQDHHATAKHYDLRLQLDGGTISFVIPRGLFSASFEQVILGIETDAHPIRYSLFEGVGIGYTKLEDVGTYEILETESEKRRRKEEQREAEMLGLVSEETTDEDEEKKPFDHVQEDRFADRYWRATFRQKPSRWGELAGPRPEPDEGQHRAMVIRLVGGRYGGLCLRFHRPSSSFFLVKPRDDPTGATVRRSCWYINLTRGNLLDAEARAALKAKGKTSLLTGRTMEEIKAATDQDRAFRAKANSRRVNGRWVQGEDWDGYKSDSEDEGSDLDTEVVVKMEKKAGQEDRRKQNEDARKASTSGRGGAAKGRSKGGRSEKKSKAYLSGN